MDLHYLEYVIEIANMKSISRAADKLYVTQSTLSQFLTKLETELGVKLFERKRNEMTLTPAGKVYVESCEHMLQEKKELYNTLAEMGDGKTGSFSVGITPQWGAVAYSHIIGPFLERFPNVKITVQEETAAPLIRMLQEGQVDMAIIPLPDDSQLEQHSILLQAEELVLAIPKEHAANLPLQYSEGQLPTLDIAALKDEPMIFSRNATTIRQLEDKNFRIRRVTPNIIAEINNHPASLIMTENGLGTTLVPVSCMTPSDKLVYAHSFPLTQWYVFISFRKGFTPHQSENYFISLAKEFFRNNSSLHEKVQFP